MTNPTELLALRDAFIEACRAANIAAIAGFNLPDSVEINYTGMIYQLAAISFYINTDLARIVNANVAEK